MNVQESTARMKTGLALTLLGSMIGYFVPAVCDGQPAGVASDRAAWVPTGNLNVASGYHTATLLLNGKVLVVGGIGNDSNLLDTTELYDPVTGMFSATGRLNAAKSGHSATLLPNGQVLVV